MKKERRERLIRRVIYLLLALALFWFIFLRNFSANGPINGHEVETFSTAGANQHVSAGVDLDYPTNPPVSGQHQETQPTCGTYADTFPDELQVHALEHAAVGILFSPDLDAEEVTQIESIVREFDTKTFSAPQGGMDTPIAVTAWGKMMKLDSVDETAIKEFIERYRNGGDAPEVSSACPNSQNGSFEAAGAGKDATPTPEPSSSK